MLKRWTEPLFIPFLIYVSPISRVQLLQAVEMEDGSALFEEFAKEEAAMAAAALSSPVATASSSSVVPVSMTGADDGPVDSAEVGQLRKRLQDLEEIADSRENRISGVSWFVVVLACCIGSIGLLIHIWWMFVG